MRRGQDLLEIHQLELPKKPMFALTLGQVAVLLRLIDAFNAKGVMQHRFISVTFEASQHCSVIAQEVHQSLPWRTAWSHLQLQHQSDITFFELVFH